MSTPTERVAVACPSCSPDGPTAHEILTEGGLATVRCTECGHTHKSDLPEEPTLERRVVVSQEGESFTARHEFERATDLAVGDEFLLDTPEAIIRARITALEVGEEQRVDEADVADVETVWTRAVGNVAVDVTLHPKQGGREETRSLTIRVPGDEEFVVGETAEYGGEEVTVEGFVVRDEASDDYWRDNYDHAGDAARAKDVKRLYARDESSTAWSAW
jgi:uncharacterized Zn finger protein